MDWSSDSIRGFPGAINGRLLSPPRGMALEPQANGAPGRRSLLVSPRILVEPGGRLIGDSADRRWRGLVRYVGWSAGQTCRSWKPSSPAAAMRSAKSDVT